VLAGEHRGGREQHARRDEVDRDDVERGVSPIGTSDALSIRPSAARRVEASFQPGTGSVRRLTIAGRTTVERPSDRQDDGSASDLVYVYVRPAPVARSMPSQSTTFIQILRLRTASLRSPLPPDRCGARLGAFANPRKLAIVEALARDRSSSAIGDLGADRVASSSSSR
jgi:hypothetical protein